MSEPTRKSMWQGLVGLGLPFAILWLPPIRHLVSGIAPFLGVLVIYGGLAFGILLFLIRVDDVAQERRE